MPYKQDEDMAYVKQIEKAQCSAPERNSSYSFHNSGTPINVATSYRIAKNLANALHVARGALLLWLILGQTGVWLQVKKSHAEVGVRNARKIIA